MRVQALPAPTDRAGLNTGMIAGVLPGIYGSPQISQVKRGSIPQPVHSRMNKQDEGSRFIKITPAFAYRPKRKELSQTDHQRLRGRANMAAATKAIRNQPAWDGSRSRLS